jgi:uncharacterized MAPEG superfamily protein
LLALWLPYLGTVIAKVTGKGYGVEQNRDPRAFLSTLDGYRKRANHAQQNGFEVTPAFGVAVIAAHQIGGAAQETIDLLALGFLASRLAYTACYVADWSALRSLTWAAGMLCMTMLFVVSF